MKQKPEIQVEYERRTTFIAYATPVIIVVMTISFLVILDNYSTASPCVLGGASVGTIIFGLIGLKMVGFQFSGRYPRRTF